MSDRIGRSILGQEKSGNGGVARVRRGRRLEFEKVEEREDEGEEGRSPEWVGL